MVDTVVVGAGLAGLSAANTLASAGRTVRVVEADDEPGGRTRTGRREDGPRAEFGGEWIGPRHRHMLRLAAELDLHLRPARQLGYPMLWSGANGTAVSRFPPLAPREGLVLLRACWRLDRLGRTVHPVRPWRSAGADEWDSWRLGAWLREQGVRGDGFRYLAAVLGALMSADIERVSLLHVLWWIARGNGIVRILHTTFAYNMLEGTQTVCTRLAERLGGVSLGRAVHRITQNDGVRVEASGGVTIQADHAVVTAPVGCLSRIEFDPPLPTPLGALDELGGRPGVKVSALLPRGHRVRHRAAVGGALVAAAWRVGPRITGFAGPDEADSPDDVLLAELAELFGARHRELRSQDVYRWSKHGYIPACDIGFAPGQLRRHGPHLTSSHGRIHFAGAERSSWPNNMEGAVESGIRAAQVILTS